jgi:ribosome-associated protein
MSIDETDDEFSGPSRSQQRRDALAILKLAESLATLSDAQLARVPLADDLLEEVRRTRAMTQQIARKRQTQFLAKHMRRLEDDEIAAIRLVLDSDRHQSNRETAALHQLEAWRDRLVAEGDVALSELLELHPDADRQHLRTLIRQAKLEAEKQKPPRASRELFRILRELQTHSSLEGGA